MRIKKTSEIDAPADTNEDNGFTEESVQSFVESKVCTIYVDKFTDSSAREFYNNFQKAKASGQSIIPIIIESYGGCADALISMMDVVQSSDMPVATIALGKAMSCGSFLLSCGTEGMRYAAPSARIMIHHISSGTWGTEPDMQVDMEETKRLQKYLFHMMAENCGKPKNYFLSKLKEKGNTDWYLTAAEAKKHNLVNHVKIPELGTIVEIINTLT